MSPAKNQVYIDKAIAAKGEQVCRQPFPKASEIIAAGIRKEIEDYNVREHGYAAFFENMKKKQKQALRGDGEAINEDYYIIWIKMTPEHKKPWICQAIAAKGIEACKKPIEKSGLRWLTNPGLDG